MDSEKSHQQTSAMIEKNQLLEVENLRSAIYSYELKAINNLQFINGGGASILIGFFSRTPLNFDMKCYFSLAITSFILGLMFSILLSFISPNFLMARYEQNYKPIDYKKYKFYRNLSLFSSLMFFVLAIIFSMLGWFATDA